MGDEETFNDIKVTSIALAAKRLGRRIKIFDQSRWERIVCSVAYTVLLQKFSQNDELARILLGTPETLIAEAAISDSYWGIGLRLDDPRTQDPTEWQGCNLLGWALMEVRSSLHEAEDTLYGASTA